MLSYTDPDGVVHPNLTSQEAMQLFRNQGFSGKINTQPEPPPTFDHREGKFLADVIELVEEPDVIEAEQTALVPVITTSTNLEVSTSLPPPPLPVEEEEEEDFANMRGRKFSSARNQFTVKSLEEILADLENLRKKEDPQDYTRNINGFMVKFEGTQPMGQFMFRDGMGEPLRITRKAYRDLCLGLCGSGAIRYMDKLVRLPNGDKVAEMNMGLFRMNTERLHLFRTALGKDNNRAIPAILSETYSTYDNVDLVKDVIMCLDDDIENWHVIRYNCRDGRLHVQLVHAEDAYFNKEVGVPIPGFTLKNGQYGDGSSSVSDSLYNLWCGNGMFNFNAKTTKRWNHTGDSGSRIRRDLPALLVALHQQQKNR